MYCFKKVDQQTEWEKAACSLELKKSCRPQHILYYNPPLSEINYSILTTPLPTTIQLPTEKEMEEEVLYSKVVKWLNCYFGNSENMAPDNATLENSLDHATEGKLPLNQLETPKLEAQRQYAEMEKEVISLFTIEGGIPLGHLGALRQYVEMDKERISSLAKEYGMDLKLAEVDKYINKHFSVITCMAHQITNDREPDEKQVCFADLPPELQQKVFSGSKVSDVVLNPAITHNVDPMGDLSSPNNESE